MATNGNQKRRKGVDQFVLAVASGATVKAAAEQSGIGERTAHRWVREPAVQTRVAELRKQYWEEAVGATASAAAEAVDTLRALLESDNEMVKLGAARTILSVAPTLREHVEFEQRLAALEARDAIKS